jgi:hypothetical protein
MMSAQKHPFLYGWRTLPEELKLHILSLTLAPKPSELDRGLLIHHHIKEARFWNQYPFLGLAAPLLGCDEIKPLVLEAFYTQNTFLVDYSSKDHSTVHGVEYMCLPPHHVAAFIQRLNVRFSMLSTERLKLLERIAAVTSRLENLVSVDLYLTPLDPPWPGISSPVDARRPSTHLDHIENIWFKSRCLRITYEHCYWSNIGLDVEEHFPAEKFTLHPSMGPAEMVSTRLIRVCDATEAALQIQEVDSWTTADSFKHFTRWTVKEVATQDKYRLKPYTRYDKKHGLV